MLVEAIGTPLPSPEQMLSFDWEQKRGLCEGRGEIWVVWGATQWGRCSLARLVFYNRGGAGVTGLMMETVSLIQATNASSVPH